MGTSVRVSPSSKRTRMVCLDMLLLMEVICPGPKFLWWMRFPGVSSSMCVVFVLVVMVFFVVVKGLCVFVCVFCV